MTVAHVRPRVMHSTGVARQEIDCLNKISDGRDLWRQCHRLAAGKRAPRDMPSPTMQMRTFGHSQKEATRQRSG